MKLRARWPVVLSVIFLLVGCGTTMREPSIAELSIANARYIEANIAKTRLAELKKGKSSSCELIDSATITYIGKSEDDLSQCLRDFPTATTLRITSSGGKVRQAIPAAKIIAERSMSIEVLAKCASSCGNYLLPAAHSVTVLPFSVVMLHGAPPADSQKILRDLSRSLKKAGRADKTNDPVFMQRHLERLLEIRQWHETFQREEHVGEEWYDLSFYYDFLSKNTGTTGLLVVSSDFATKCLRSTTEIVSFWEPQSPIERSLAGSMFVGPPLIMGFDIANPEGC